MIPHRLRHHHCDLNLYDTQVSQRKVVPYLLRELRCSFYNRPKAELVVLLLALVLRGWELPLVVLVVPW